MIDKATAINSLMPTVEFAVRDGVIEWINQTTAPLTDAQIDAEVIRLQAEYDAKDYQRNRKKEYPSIPDQLDTLYHSGLDAWKAEIKTVKDKYPKPN
jgi:hypothetical protein